MRCLDELLLSDGFFLLSLQRLGDAVDFLQLCFQLPQVLLLFVLLSDELEHLELYLSSRVDELLLRLNRILCERLLTNDLLSIRFA